MSLFFWLTAFVWEGGVVWFSCWGRARGGGGTDEERDGERKRTTRYDTIRYDTDD